MVDAFFVAGFSLVMAAITLPFAILLERIPNTKIQKILPLGLGILLIAKGFSPYFLLPLFIIAPLPFFEKKTNTVDRLLTIFYGGFVTTAFLFVFSTVGPDYVAYQWQGDGLLWTVCSIVTAFLIFFGIDLGRKSIPRTSQDTTATPGSEENIHLGEENKGIIYFVGLLILLAPLVLLGLNGDGETCRGFDIVKINSSGIPDGAIHLTDDDFRAFPRMAPFIRDTQYSPGGCMNPGDCVGTGSIACNKESIFDKYNGKLLEYQGRIYMMKKTYYA